MLIRKLTRILIGSVIFYYLTLPVLAATGDVWSNRVENNFAVDGEHWGLGGRSYMNYGTSHAILRYKFDDSWASQYRYVTKKGGDTIEHWFRLQHKDIKLKAFFWNTRIEYRIKESTDKVFRIRPQTGFKFNVFKKVKAYYKGEPHWEYDFGKQKGYFKFAQHFIGFNIKLNKNVLLGPFIEIDTNDNWKKELVFLGTEFEVKIK